MHVNTSRRFVMQRTKAQAATSPVCYPETVQRLHEHQSMLVNHPSTRSLLSRITISSSAPSRPCWASSCMSACRYCQPEQASQHTYIYLSVDNTEEVQYVRLWPSPPGRTKVVVSQQWEPLLLKAGLQQAPRGWVIMHGCGVHYLSNSPIGFTKTLQCT